ncbi:TIR domain-containing protein [Candidatus Avelusimicrobium aviculae]|uniref:TIR domain-containing protein n=1 Tax=Candidatus Avelusimicrobium aviculae TaxID=3416206 RepID=UPI003D0A1086
MAYRNGTYVAFDALGETNPCNSDFKHFALIKAWTENDNIDFSFVDSHEKTYAVQDTSLLSTLKKSIQERLRNSKQMLVILSPNTRLEGSMLSYEIEQAVDIYHLPLIIVYTGIEKIAGVIPSWRWPNSLRKRIREDRSVRAIHIPYLQIPIQWALKQFSIHDAMPQSPEEYYTAY